MPIPFFKGFNSKRLNDEGWNTFEQKLPEHKKIEFIARYQLRNLC